MEIDVKNFQNVLMVAVVMGLIGVAISLGGVEDAAAAAIKAGAKSKTAKTGTTPKKKVAAK